MVSSKIRIAAVIASLAALAIILSPVFSLPSLVQNPDRNPSGASDIISEEPINETAIAPLEVSEEDFEECNSISQDIDAIIVEVDESRANVTRKTSADLLVGEYCNRPALVHEINATGNPGLSLAAYGCDAANGRAGDAPMRDSLADHVIIYCESASYSIQEEADSLRGAAEGFREDYIIALKAESEASEGNSTASADEIARLEASLDGIIGMIDRAELLAESDEYYNAAKMLDSASKSFEALLEQTEA